MSEEKKTTLNNDEWEKLKDITDKLINYLDFNKSTIETVPQLKLQYDKVVDIYNTTVENKDQEILESVKDKLFKILNDTIRIQPSNERSEYEFDCYLPDDF